jgi:hypothetical protein
MGRNFQTADLDTGWFSLLQKKIASITAPAGDTFSGLQVKNRL